MPATDDPKFAIPSNTIVASAMSEAEAKFQESLKQAKDRPTEFGPQLDLQLYRFLQLEPVPQQEVLAQLSTSDREILAALMDGLSNFRQNLQADPTALPSVTIRPLLKMAERLREQTELSIPTIQLCRHVEGFGIYEPMPLMFRAGSEHETLIYCEVENFTSRKNDKDLWETKLSLEAALYNSEGHVVLKGKDVVPVDVCRNRRRDFFVVKRLMLPKTLAPTRYILKLTIVDANSNRVAENSLYIDMMAQ
jgi:hypothetical protein